MKKELKVFFTALAFYTRIPCYHLGDYSPESMNKSAKYCALIGWIVGSLAFAAYFLSSLIFSPSLSILISIIITQGAIFCVSL